MTLAPTRQAAVPAASARFPTTRARFRRAAALWLARRTKTAQAKAEGAPIGPGERVLTLERGPAGSLVAATAAAVYIGDQTEPAPTWCRLGWEEVTRIGWQDRRHLLALIGAGPGSACPAPVPARATACSAWFLSHQGSGLWPAGYSAGIPVCARKVAMAAAALARIA